MGRETVDREALAWAAGFWDGEGCAGVYFSREGRPQVQVAISQAHREVLDRFGLIIGLGSVRGPSRLAGDPTHWKPRFQWQANSYEALTVVAGLLWPWLGSEKREQFRRAVLDLRAHYIERGSFPAYRPRRVVAAAGHRRRPASPRV